MANEHASELLLRPKSGSRIPTAAAALRVLAGAVYLAFGVGKFTSHATEVASFETYGLPSPEAFVYAIGVMEVVGGVLLILGAGTRVAALVLAGDMVGAIVFSGVKEGEVISLTLAPALLITMVFLIWAGAGTASLDERMLTRARRRSEVRGEAPG
jgi:putative oxidoreductase